MALPAAVLILAACGVSASVAGEWGGQTFYFCSRGCKAEFMVDPDTFVAAAMVLRKGDMPLRFGQLDLK